MREKIIYIAKESADLKTALLENEAFIDQVEQICKQLIQTFQKDGKVFLCGNGGSASDAQHIAAELSGRFYIDRKSLFAEALHVNSAYLTAVANDYGYDRVFSRLVDAKVSPEDVLIGLSTSGTSANVVNALERAKSKGAFTIGLTGQNYGKMEEYSDILIKVPSTVTPRIQEVHLMIGHIFCEIVEKELFG